MFPPNSVTNCRVELEGSSVPAKVYVERRNSIRFSIAKNSVIMRLPNALSAKEQTEQWHRFVLWSQDKLAKNEVHKERFVGKNYEDGTIISCYGRQYTLSIAHEQRSRHTAKYDRVSRVISLFLNPDDDESSLVQATRHLISRCVAADCLPAFSRRVVELNHLYFKKEIRNIAFKYNTTNWGSCSSNKNLNFSTRLLFAPMETIDYVIIHELSHLTEMNHSDRFWALVEACMPDYKEHEAWLRKNNHLCNF